MTRDDLGPGGAALTATGTVLFFWDGDDTERHLLVNIEPDDHHKPNSWDLHDDVRDAVVGEIVEGARIELEYTLEHHEVVDPEGATTHDDVRPRVVRARIERALPGD